MYMYIWKTIQMIFFKNRFFRKYTENIVKILWWFIKLNTNKNISSNHISSTRWKPRHAAHYRLNYRGTLHQQLLNRIFEQHNENAVRLKTINNSWWTPSIAWIEETLYRYNKLLANLLKLQRHEQKILIIWAVKETFYQKLLNLKMND